MADVTPNRRNIQFEETQFRAAVSEATLQKVGASLNFVNDFQYDTKAYFLNGRYGGLGAQDAVDGLYVFPFNVEIVDVLMFNSVAGSGGTTTLDIKKASLGSSTFASIFSTPPAISSAAGNYARVSTSGGPIGEAFSGTTQPVLSSTSLSAGDAIRVDLTGVQSGNPENCGLIIYMRPDN